MPYFAAEGSEIKNHGQKDLCGVDADWNPLAANVNMADIKSNLAGGMPIIQADNRIVLDKSGSYIENKKTGSRIKVNHEGGSFTFDFYLPMKKKESSKGQAKGKGRSKGKAARWEPVQAAQSSYFSPLQEEDQEDEDSMDVGVIDMGFHGQEWR